MSPGASSVGKSQCSTAKHGISSARAQSEARSCGGGKKPNSPSTHTHPLPFRNTSNAMSCCCCYCCSCYSCYSCYSCCFCCWCEQRKCTKCSDQIAGKSPQHWSSTAGCGAAVAHDFIAFTLALAFVVAVIVAVTTVWLQSKSYIKFKSWGGGFCGQRLTHTQSDKQNHWQNDSMTAWLTDWRSDALTKWLVDWLPGCRAE